MTNPDTRTIPDRSSRTQRTALRKPVGWAWVLFAGLLLALAHPPLGLFPLAWAALAPLLRGITEAPTPRRAALYGYGFGWAFLGLTWYWIALTIGAWTGSLALGVVAWFGLTAILAGFYAGFGFVGWHLVRRAKSEGLGWLGLAAAWTVMEWARTLGSLTMPWAQLSYSQFRVLPLIQISDLTGAYGVSFLLVLLNAGVAHLWKQRGKWGSAQFLWAFGTLNLFACFYGAARLIEPEGGPKILAAAAQTGLDPLIKTTPAEQWARIDGLLRQTQTLPSPPHLLAFAESDLPPDRDPDTAAAHLRELAGDFPGILAINGRARHPVTGRETNTTLLLKNGNAPVYRYDKQQLVPFGEFIPFRPFWPQPLQKTFGFFEEDVQLGTDSTPLRDASGLALGTFICYESMYPPYARLMTANGANLLLTQSNDAWFQSRAAQEQHLAAVVFRGVENRRDVVRSTTNGITCLIDAKGRMLGRLPANVSDLLVGEVTLRAGKTLYNRTGDLFVFACLAFLLALLFSGAQKEIQKKNR